MGEMTDPPPAKEQAAGLFIRQVQAGLWDDYLAPFRRETGARLRWVREQQNGGAARGVLRRRFEYRVHTSDGRDERMMEIDGATGRVAFDIARAAAEVMIDRPVAEINALDGLDLDPLARVTKISIDEWGPASGTAADAAEE